jgi:hypothetical protein
MLIWIEGHCESRSQYIVHRKEECEVGPPFAETVWTTRKTLWTSTIIGSHMAVLHNHGYNYRTEHRKIGCNKVLKNEGTKELCR